MKKTSITKPTENKIAPQYGFRKLRPLKIPKMAWYALLLAFVMAVTLFVLYLITFIGTKDTKRTLLIYNDGSTIPEVSLRNSLAASEFGYEIIDPGKMLDDQSYIYELPKGYTKEEVVVCAVGKDAFKIMDDLISSGAENIEGYVLISPEYPGNASLAKYTEDNPDVPCAIYGFDSKAKTSNDLTGAQMIFEKISGVDTMYGHPTKRGKVFSSKVYVSPNQKRYLSLYSTDIGTSGLISSVNFQNELSQYLGTTFGKGFASSRIAVRQMILTIAVFLSVASLALFLFMVPVAVPEKARKELKGRDSLGAIIFLGLSGWLALTGIVLTFIPQVKMYAKYVALYAPVLIIALMALAQLKLLLSNKFKYSRKDDGFPIFLASIFIGIVEIMVITGTALNVTNIEKAFSNSTNWVNALIVFIVMSLSAVALILSDKKSKASGQGRTAYFASPAYFIESLVPSAVLLVIGMMQGNKELAVYSAVGVGISVLPCVCAIPIKRISDYYEVSGLVFGIIAGIIVFLAG